MATYRTVVNQNIDGLEAIQELCNSKHSDSFPHELLYSLIVELQNLTSAVVPKTREALLRSGGHSLAQVQPVNEELIEMFRSTFGLYVTCAVVLKLF